MTNPDTFPQAPDPNALLWDAASRRASALKMERVNDHVRRGAQRFNAGTGAIERVPDARTDADVYVWRAATGEMFVEVQEFSDTHHDAIVVDVVNESAYQTLKLIDADEYALHAARHQAETDRAEAARAAEQEHADEERRNAPQHAVMPRPSTWDVPTLLARVEASAGHLSAHEHRVLLTVPSAPHLVGTEVDFANAVNTLRPLLVASALGTRAVPCDLDGCDEGAITVAAGGGFVCANHGG